MARIQVKGVCPHDCPDTCGLVTEVEGERAVKVQGNPAHPVTRGWLCAKVRPYLEHVYHPGRLTHPLRRSGPKGGGGWQPITWEEAIEEIARRWQAIIERYSPEAILPYSYSGTLGMVQNYVASGRFWNRLGASQLERAICGAAAEMAVRATTGDRISPPYADVANSRLVILWGTNPVSTSPHFMPFLRKAQRSGARLVVIDPRLSRSAKGADWHLAPLPGTDAALALGIAHVIVREGWHDERWLEERSVGWSAFRQRLKEYSPRRVANICGLSVKEVERLARLYATRRPGLLKINDGINRNLNGGQSVRAISTLPALTGQYGLPGGGLAYSNSGYIKWDQEVIHKWRSCPPPGRIVNMNRLGAALTGEIADPPIKSLFVFAANPAASSPNAGRIVEGLMREDLFTVVHELFMTDTADYADIVLPATSQLEQVDLHKASGHSVLAYNRRAIPPLGESKSNWDVMRLLAEAMGFEESWLREEADVVIRELLASARAGGRTMNSLTLERLQEEGAISLNPDGAVPFADGRFPTPSGKIELFSKELADLGHDPLPGWDETAQDDGDLPNRAADQALTFMTPADHHFVSSSLAGQPSLLERSGEPTVEINPSDAAQREISDGQQVIVENGRGWVRLMAAITEDVRPGVIASPKGRWSNLSGGRNVNWTTPDALADFAGQSTFHSNRVWIRPDDAE